MPNSINLKELIEFASQSAATIFRRTGQLLTMYHAVTASGETLIIPQPNTDKDTAAEMLRELFAEQDVEFFVMLTEAWMLDTNVDKEPDIDAVMRQGLQHHPDRREIIAFAAESRDGKMQTAHRFILRPEHGKPKLSPLHMNDMTGVKSEGRMVGLLKEKP